jgi:hypothetical protein
MIMFIKDYEWYLRHLMEHAGLEPKNLLFVDSVAGWCREHGLKEIDDKRPFRLVSGNGSGTKMVVAARVDDDVIEKRINALFIRSQLRSVVTDRSELLNSNTRKLAYLFLKELADVRPESQGDEFGEDEWIFDQLGRIGTLTP